MIYERSKFQNNQRNPGVKRGHEKFMTIYFSGIEKIETLFERERKNGGMKYGKKAGTQPE